MDTNVLLNLKRRCEMKQRIPNTIYSKEFREQSVKQVTEELAKTKRELAEIKRERDLLKKAAAYFAREVR